MKVYHNIYSKKKTNNFFVLVNGEESFNQLSEMLNQLQFDKNIIPLYSNDGLEKMLASSKPDVIIADIDFGETNIHKVSKLLSDSNLSIPLIILTTIEREESVISLLNSKFSDYVFKEHPKRLLHSINLCLYAKEKDAEGFYLAEDLKRYEQHLGMYYDYEANIPGMTFQFILHPDGENSYTYVGSASKRIFNLEQQDIVRDSSLLHKLFDCENIKQLYESFRLSAITLNPFQHEVYRIRDNKKYWYQFNAKPKRQQDGSVIWNGILLDTTELRDARNELETEKKLNDDLINSIKQNEDDNTLISNNSAELQELEVNDNISALTNAVFDQFLFKIFMEYIPDAVYFKDIDSKFIKVNKSFVKKINASSEKDFLGKTDFDIFNFEHANEARNDELRIIQTGDPLINKIEKEILPTGITAWVSTSKIPIVSYKGEIIGTFGISRDITEQRIAEDELSKQQNLMRELIDTLPDKIYVKDRNGKFLLNNKAHLNFLRINNSEEVIGKSDFDFFDSETAQKYWEDDLYVIKTGKPMYSRIEQMNNVKGDIEWFMNTKVPFKSRNDEIIGIVNICHDITESKNTTEKLRASEARLNHLITTTSAVLYTMQISKNNFSLTWVGENIKQFGYSAVDVKVPGFWGKIVHPDDSEYFLSNKKNILNNERSVMEYRICKSNNDYIWVRDEMVVIFDTFGKAKEIFGSWLDITERMQSEAALLNIESQLNSALKIARLGYWEYDVPTDTFSFNDQFYSLYRTTAEREGGYLMPSQVYAERFLYPDDKKFVGEGIKTALETKDPKSITQIEHRIIYADGEVGYMYVQFNVIKDNEGRTIKTYGANQDITQRKKVEEALKASEYFLLKSQSVAHIGSYKFDIKREIWDSSETLNEIMGVEKPFPKSVKKYLGLIHPSYVRDIIKHIKDDVIAGKNRFEKEFKIIRANDAQERWILGLGDVEYDNENNPTALIGTIQDITERVFREQEKQELENQLRKRNIELEKTLADIKMMQESLVQSEKMASLGQISAGIAHEINNPLAFVSSNYNRIKEYFGDILELLSKWQGVKSIDYENEVLTSKISEIDEFTEKIDLQFIIDDFNRMTKSIQEGTQRIKKIIDGMRGFSHISDNTFEETDINTIIDETITIVWNELKYKTSLEKNYESVSQVKCNINEIKQVLVNLLINASQAIDEKGIITISTYSSDNFVFVEIKDTGCGISKENLKKIFDPFFTTKPVGRGTGLGLWICSIIMEKHNGSITAKSELGIGTTFILKLPIV